MSAPELSPEEQDIVARFDAAETPPEVLREQVALAIAAADQENHGVDWERLDDWERKVYRSLADAALAVFRGQQDPSVQRVLELADELTEDADRTTDIVGRISLRDAANRIRAAIGGDGR